MVEQTLLPRIPRDHMRRGAMWFIMWRKHAALLLKDVQYCKSFLYGWGVATGASEHYYQTFLSRLVAQELANRTLEYQEPLAGVQGAVRTFGAPDVTETLLRSIKGRACLLQGQPAPASSSLASSPLTPWIRWCACSQFGVRGHYSDGGGFCEQGNCEGSRGVQQPSQGPGRDLCVREQSLMRVVSRTPKGAPGKIAFLFLTRGASPWRPCGRISSQGQGRRGRGSIPFLCSRRTPRSSDEPGAAPHLPGTAGPQPGEHSHASPSSASRSQPCTHSPSSPSL